MKKAIISFKILAVLAILISIPLLYKGITGAVRCHRAKETYLSAEAVVSGYEEVEERRFRRYRTYYRLSYAYTVEGGVYYIADDLLDHAPPPAGYSREILYDPADPENAMLTGESGSSASLLAGLMFLLIPAVMLFGWLIVTDRLSIRAENAFDVFVGVVMAIIGFGTIYGMTGALSIITAFQKYSFIIVIPVLMILTGLYQTVKSIFGK